MPVNNRDSKLRLAKTSAIAALSAITARAATLTGCFHDSDNDQQPLVNGTTFTLSSATLSPFVRTNGEGFAGMAWLDYDNDGDLDVFILNENGSSSALMRNNGDTTFTDVTVAANAVITTGSSAVVAGDIDNDGYTDLYVVGNGRFFGPVQSLAVLLHNQGDGTFVNIANSAGVPGGKSALSAAMADINNDGYLDLFVTAPGHLGFGFPPAEQDTDKLYLNNGNLTFTDITAAAGVSGGRGSCVNTFSHYDDDEFIDLFVGICNDVTLAPTPFHVYRNNGDNTFTDVAVAAKLDGGGYWMSSTMGDFNNDGYIDLFASNFGIGANAPHALYQNNGDGTYTNVASTDLAEQEFSWGGTAADFDNDGWLDLFYVGSTPLNGPRNPGRLFMNDGSGNLIQDNTAHGLDLSNRNTSGITSPDYDNDGFADVMIVTAPYMGTDGAPVLLHNDGNTNNWLTVKLVGTTSNRMGIGARIQVSTTDHAQVREIYAGSGFASSESPWPTFGLGVADRTTVIVTWPSGLVESFGTVDANGLAELTEGMGTAQP